MIPQTCSCLSAVGFYWLPPVVAPPSYSGVFDAALSPTVEICELTDGACAISVRCFIHS